MATANAAGQWAERRKVTLRVKENPLSRVLVQIVISVNAQTFTQADLVGLLLVVHVECVCACVYMCGDAPHAYVCSLSVVWYAVCCSMPCVLWVTNGSLVE